MTHKLITDSAKGQMCTVRIPNVCNFSQDTTIFAHLNSVRFKHGMGNKSLFGAYACSSCHDILDRRVNSKFTKDELLNMHYAGTYETMLRIISNHPDLWQKFLNQ